MICTYQVNYSFLSSSQREEVADDISELLIEELDRLGIKGKNISETPGTVYVEVPVGVEEKVHKAEKYINTFFREGNWYCETINFDLV